MNIGRRKSTTIITPRRSPVPEREPARTPTRREPAREPAYVPAVPKREGA